MANNNPNLENLNSYKPKWKLGKTKTIRVPIVIADKILSIAHEIDNNQLIQNNKYQNSIECLEEYFKEKGLNLEELQTSRVGTKKQQLAEIHQWLVNQTE